MNKLKEFDKTFGYYTCNDWSLFVIMKPKDPPEKCADPL